MLKKIQLSALVIAVAFGFQERLMAQCGNGAPPDSWEAVFSAKVKEEAQKMLAGKSKIVTKTIPVVVHVIHFGETIGTYPNIDSSQIKTQVAVLNQDFGGTGDGVSGIPPEFAAAIANSGIQFCRAAVDHTGTVMLEPGAHRINAGPLGWPSPSTPTLDLQAYFNDIIIPSTIWDPAKYLNIWVSDRASQSTLTSFGTYPPNSGQIGVPNSNIGSTTNDGIWVYAKALGTTAAVVAPTNKGRSATHQLGHYFGLRHIWGDGNCLPDYCDDTPVQKGPTSGCPVGPTPIDICGVNASPFGNMYMNFMDETEDACKYMFTHDQALRMMTALNQSPLRNALGTHGLCDVLPKPPASAANASFSIPGGKICLGMPFMPDNSSTGFPQPTFVWSSVPAAQFLPNNTMSHPNILITNPGQYVITLVASNSVSASTYTMKVSTQFSCEPEHICVDTLKAIKDSDTLTILRAPTSGQVSTCTNSSTTGYLTGTSCYLDKELAQYFPPNTFTGIPYPQVNSVIIIFDSAATKGSGTVVCKIYGGTPAGGPAGSLGNPKTEFISSISSSAKTYSTEYIGKPNYQPPGRQMIAYKFDFDKPILITAPSAGFFVGLEIPQVGDSVAIFSDTKTNTQQDSSAWFRNQFGTWRTFRYYRNSKIHLAILPQISCSAITDISEQNILRGEHVTLMPNPGTGAFKLVLSLPQPEEITIGVYNMMGQKILSTDRKQVSTYVAELDLSHESDGIYFVEISNGSQKVVKKLVLTH